MMTARIAVIALALLAAPSPVLAQGQPQASEPAKPQLNDGSRFAQACESSARRALVVSMEFDLNEVVDSTASGVNTVEIYYDATSRNSGRVYHQVFTCYFRGIDDPENVVLDAALESGRPYPPNALGALNQMLQADGFQKPD